MSSTPAPSQATGLLSRIGDRLSRVTSSGQFVPEIDGLRFLAIASVVVFHVHDYLRDSLAERGQAVSGLFPLLVEQGKFGVQLFFVISGFVLGLPFAAYWLGEGKKVSLRKYFTRRLTRLEPPYLVNLVFCWAIKAAMNPAAAGGLLPHVLASAFYVHNVVYAQASAVNTVAWSLEVEVQFYILAPVLAFLFAIRAPRLRRAVLVAATVAAGIPAAFLEAESRLFLSLAYHLQFFLAGFLLADIYVTDWKRAPARSTRWDVVGLVAAPLTLLAAMHQVTRALLFPLATVVLYVAVFRSTWLNRAFTWRPFTIIGGMCYTVYLYHASVIKLMAIGMYDLTAAMPYAAQVLVQSALVTLPVVGVSAVMFVMLERPCMVPGWPARLAARVRSVVGRREPMLASS